MLAKFTWGAETSCVISGFKLCCIGLLLCTGLDGKITPYNKALPLSTHFYLEFPIWQIVVLPCLVHHVEFHRTYIIPLMAHD